MGLAAQMKSFARRIRQALIHPGEFFTGAAKEQGYSEAFQLFAILSAVNLVLMFIAQHWLFSGTLNSLLLSMVGSDSSSAGEVSLFTWFLITLGFYLVSLLGVFIGTLFLHVWVKMWGGKGEFAESLRLNVYSNIPHLVLGWIPFAGAVLWIYDLVLAVIGVQKLHQVSRAKAIAMFVIPVVLEIMLLMGSVYGGYRFLVARQAARLKAMSPVSTFGMPSNSSTSTK